LSTVAARVAAVVAAAAGWEGSSVPRACWTFPALVTGLACLACGPLAGAAGARVALVATGTGEAAILDVTTNRVVARPTLSGPSTAVAVTRDGAHAFLAGGSSIVPVDLHDVTSGEPRTLGGAPISALAVSPKGGTLYATSGTRLLLIDPETLAVRRRVGLRGVARALALSPSGSLAAVVLERGRVAIVATAARKLVRRVKVPGATAVAFDRGGVAWITTPRRLRTLRPGKRRVEKRSVRLPRGAGGGIAISPDGGTLAVGAADRGARGALVTIATRRSRGFASGRGPGTPAWSPDGIRVYVADAGGGGLSLVSPFAQRRIGEIRLGKGLAPRAVAVQPGLARIAGGETADDLVGTRLPDLLEGLGGDDKLSGGRDNDRLFGGDGNDLLAGGSYDDLLDGGPGDDRLVAGSGNDRIEGGDGIDSADGGTGNDSIHGSDGNDRLDGGAGDDRVYGEGGDDEIVETTFGNDRRLYGGPGNDLIRGGRGSDLIKGGDGDDRLFGETGTENITGGDGNDEIDGGRARDLLEGNNGRDVVKGDAGDDTVSGGEGADTVDGGSGADELYGDDGPDIVIGGTEPDLIDAGAGDDVVRAADLFRDEVDCGDGNDTVYVEDIAPTRDALVGCETVIAIPPEAATDAEPPSVISGTPRNDLLRGTPGPDSLFGKAGRDRMFGGGGDDYVDGEWGDDELHGGPGDDTIAGRSADDRIFGDDGADHITGDRGADRIAGGGGDDTIFGNLGPDVISGGSGNDRINVVRGEHDAVRCGGGRDVVLADGGDRVARDCEDVRR